MFMIPAPYFGKNSIKKCYGNSVLTASLFLYQNCFRYDEVVLKPVSNLNLEDFQLLLCISTFYHHIRHLSRTPCTFCILYTRLTFLYFLSGIWNNAGMDSLSIAYMGIALAELDILIYNIQHSADNVTGALKSDSEVSEYLYTCCKHHNKIMELVIQNDSFKLSKYCLFLDILKISKICVPKASWFIISAASELYVILDSI